MKYSTALLLIVTVILYSGCENNGKEKVRTAIKSDSLINKYQFVSYNYCSKNLLFDDQVFGNTMIQITPNQNFLKCTNVNDSEFVFSCGRGKKEVVVSEIECQLSNGISFDGLILPKLSYDDEEIMILKQQAGSDSWINYFVVLPRNKVYSEQAMYIDFDNRKYVYLECSDYKNKNVFFIVHDIMSDFRDTVKSNYYKFGKGGYPALHISNVLLNYDSLFYSVDIDSSMVRDTLIY